MNKHLCEEALLVLISPAKRKSYFFYLQKLINIFTKVQECNVQKVKVKVSKNLNVIRFIIYKMTDLILKCIPKTYNI